jgi:hypothetical protein
MRPVQGSNIGVAVYARGETPGTLDARWSYENAWGGPGHATGGPEHGFAGRYHIRYYLENGEFSDEYDLTVERAGDLYDVTWFVDGEIRAVGVGMEVEDRLAVGWRRVSE